MTEELKKKIQENNQSTKEQISIKNKIKNYLLSIFKGKKKRENQLIKKSGKTELNDSKNNSKEKSCILTNLLEKLSIEHDARRESSRRHACK